MPRLVVEKSSSVRPKSAKRNGRLERYHVVSGGICARPSNAFAHLSVHPNTIAYGRNRVKMFSCSAHRDMCVSAVSITVRNPPTRRAIAVPFAVLLGIQRPAIVRLIVDFLRARLSNDAAAASRVSADANVAGVLKLEASG